VEIHLRGSAVHESLIHLIESLGCPRILVIGDLMLDRYVWGNADRISPEAPIPILRVHRIEERLGGAAGVAGILRVLEAEVTLAGVLGDDEAGRRCQTLLEAPGIDSSMVQIDVSRQTTVKERLIGRAEQKHPQQVLRVDYETDTPPSESTLELITKAVRQRIHGHDIVLISDYSKGVCQPALIRTLITECRERGIRLLVDPSRNANDLSGYRGCSTLTPNRREAGLATGRTLTDVKTAGAAAQQLRRSLDLEVGLITLDREGMILADDQGWQLFPVRPREVYDITGAGDVALAMLGVVLACGHGYPEAIRLANVAAGLSVESVGVTAVSRREVINDLLGHLPSRIKKLVSKEILVQEMSRLREAGLKIVFTNGCFDILHTGHIHLLREARGLGDRLVVGLNSDASVRRLGKGEGRPINRETSRAQVLSALECVDFVCIFEEDTPESLVQEVRPDILVKGADFRSKHVAGTEFVESYGGRLHFVELTPEQSTTGTINRIKKL
jgi:D-beta-D-heptose 7-phosphate kinase / D-beta-D-heptose 1-phosphate adenosyltransferase